MIFRHSPLVTFEKTQYVGYYDAEGHVVLASVSIGTKDGLFFGTTSLTATITAAGDNGKCNGRDLRSFKPLVCYLTHQVKCHSYSRGMPVIARGHCRR